MTPPEQQHYLRIHIPRQQYTAAKSAAKTAGFDCIEAYLRTCLQQLVSGENVITPPTARRNAFLHALDELALQWGIHRDTNHDHPQTPDANNNRSDIRDHPARGPLLDLS